MNDLFEQGGNIRDPGLEDSAMRRSQEFAHLFQAVSANYPGSILIADRNRIILYANPASARTTGYPVEELIGQSMDLIHVQASPGEVHQSISEAIDLRGMWNGDVTYRNKSGEEYIETKTVAAIRGDDGRVQYYFSIGEDVSRRRNLNIKSVR